MYGDVVSYNVVLYRISVDAVLYVKLLIVDMKQIRHLCSAFIQTKFRIIARMEDIYPSLQNTIYIDIDITCPDLKCLKILHISFHLLTKCIYNYY